VRWPQDLALTLKVAVHLEGLAKAGQILGRGVQLVAPLKAQQLFQELA
jgi:hypothetical protein